MRKFILIMVLAILSSNAMAEWIRVNSTDEFTAYVNPSSIRKNGNRVKMWSMYDFNQMQNQGNGPFMSAVNQSEYDCKEEQGRMLATTGYYGNMSKGRTIFSAAQATGWMPIVPGSIDNALWNAACGRG